MNTHVSYAAIVLGAVLVAIFGLSLMSPAFAQLPPGELHEECCCIPASGKNVNPDCNVGCQSGTPTCDAPDKYEEANPGECKAHAENSCTDGYRNHTFTVLKYDCGPSEDCTPPVGGKRCKSEEVSPPDESSISVKQCNGGPCGDPPHGDCD